MPGRKPIRMGMGILSFRRPSISYIFFSILLCPGLRIPPYRTLMAFAFISYLSMVRIVYIAFFSGYHTLIFLRQYHYFARTKTILCIDRCCPPHREHRIISSTPQSSPPYILPTPFLLLSPFSRLVSFFHSLLYFNLLQYLLITGTITFCSPCFLDFVVLTPPRDTTISELIAPSWHQLSPFVALSLLAGCIF